jgi:hypothetical protein
MPLLVTGLAVSPDNSRLVTIGFQIHSPRAAMVDSNPTADRQGEAVVVAPLSSNGGQGCEHRMNVYDLVTREMLSYVGTL